MNPRIASIENLIARDPGGRNVFGLVVADQLRLAAQSLRLAKRVAVVSGFFIPEAGAGETDGPPGAKAVGEALTRLGIRVDYLTDERNAPLFRALGVEPVIPDADYLDHAAPTHLLSIERVGRGADGRYRNMRGQDITSTTAPLDDLFLDAGRRGLTTIGIGDGGNEIGMGRVFAEALETIKQGSRLATVVATDFCIAAGVSNWGAYGLVGAISVLDGRDLLPNAAQVASELEQLIHVGGAVDGISLRRECTVDGLPLAETLRILEEVRHHIVPSPLERGAPLTVGIVGYAETGRAAAALLMRRGHKVRVSEAGSVTLDGGIVAAGVETGGHTLGFLGTCDLVVFSPGVPADAPIRQELHRNGVPVMSELELAFQLGTAPLIAVTGTVGKRTTVELFQRIMQRAGHEVAIGGNRGRPLSALLLERASGDPYTAPSRAVEPGQSGRVASSRAGGDPCVLAVAVSSFQLETVVHFRPHIAIMLNINEAHLDRHRSVAEYVRIKSRIFMNQHPDDILVLNYDDPRLRPLARKHHGRTYFVSARQAVDRGAWLADGRVRANIAGDAEDLGAIACPFAENLLSAVVAARLCGVSATELAAALAGDLGDRA
ncbi:MAG: DUF4392 domain-containing protein [Planctomycetes bacterium]|nr:DUF4392 domain-containing protein [Planctomycetota bacterium]